MRISDWSSDVCSSDLGGTDAVRDDRLALRKRRPSLVDAACENIRASILSGVHRPGAQLPTEAEFVDVMRVSRTVIREAIDSIPAAGMAEARQSKGLLVTETARYQGFQIMRAEAGNSTCANKMHEWTSRPEKGRGGNR